MIEGAIFDFDGTLFDSMAIWENIGENYLRTLGVEPEENLKKTFQNFSLYQAACYYREIYHITLSVQDIMDGVCAMVEKYYMETAQPKPGAIPFLEQLWKRGVKMCIATANDDALVTAVLSKWDLEKYFSTVLTCTSMGCGKDEPVIYREALRHLKTEKSATVVFEDAAHAIKTARQDGFPTAAVYDRYEKDQAAVIQYADVYITDYRDAADFWKFAAGIHA